MEKLQQSQLKYVSLVVLCLQNSLLAIVMRLSRTGDGPLYLVSTAVVSAEALKTITCVAVLCYQNRHRGIGVAFTETLDEAFGDLGEVARVAIPSFAYLLQNNLQYYALSNVEAATFQVVAQLKILTTAVFSVTILSKRLRPMQWFSLLLLMAGVAVVQLSSSNNVSASEQSNSLTGLLAILAACGCSGFAGVYTEKILKGSATSLWMRNIQMGSTSFLAGLIGIYFSESSIVRQRGFFYGYNGVVCFAVFLQVFGGLITAVVVKYADNILKSFATAIAVVISCVLSIFIFGIWPNGMFLLGAAIVNSAVYLYNHRPPVVPVKGPYQGAGQHQEQMAALGSHKSLESTV